MATIAHMVVEKYRSLSPCSHTVVRDRRIALMPVVAVLTLRRSAVSRSDPRRVSRSLHDYVSGIAADKVA